MWASFVGLTFQKGRKRWKEAEELRSQFSQRRAGLANGDFPSKVTEEPW